MSLALDMDRFDRLALPTSTTAKGNTMYGECEGTENVQCNGEPRWVFDPHALPYGDHVEIYVCEGHEKARS